MVKTGDHVIYHGSDYEGPATVLHARARDGKDPLVTLAFVHPKRTDVLGQPNWRNAFDRRFDVESDRDAKEGQAHYTLPKNITIFRVPLKKGVALPEGHSSASAPLPEPAPEGLYPPPIAPEVMELHETLQAIAEEASGAITNPLPSAADLDAVAAEQRAVEKTAATNSEPYFNINGL